jgi:F-type H+-transporting ATPase subunit b
MDEALAKTNEERDRLLDDTRAHAEALLVRARESIEEERNRALTEVRGEVTDLALLAAGRALADGVSTETHRQVIDDFISGLEKE